jgi:UDP-N-acetylmuramoylalanine--D-glutamate ligase
MAGDDFSVHGRRVVVLGAARSGIAAAELLVRRGARVTLSEVRPQFEDAARLRASGVDVETGGHGDETLRSAELIVTSPGVPLEQSAVASARAHGVEVIGELELASRWIKGRMIAVTGTKGKSTTTTLIGRMLEAAGRPVLVGGNIGVPLSAQVDASTAETVHVVEASSFQLETTSQFKPWISLWLNVADDHLDRHPNMPAYVAAKARILANQGAEDVAVLNADDPIVASQHTAARRVWFSPSATVDEGFVVDGAWIVRRTAAGREPMVPTAAVELAGRHMLDNVTAAVAVGWSAGVSSEAMTQALRGFRGLEHVMEPVGRLGDVRFVNDSKATNVEAARRSIESFPAGVVAIVGGRFKSGDLRGLTPALAVHGRAVVAIGEAAALVSEAVRSVVPVITAGNMREAVEQAYRQARPDGVVLLAPACASFDWFRDYAERGRAFKREVEALQRQGGER